MNFDYVVSLALIIGSGERDGFPLPEKVHNARIYRFKPLDCAVNVKVTFKHI